MQPVPQFHVLVLFLSLLKEQIEGKSLHRLQGIWSEFKAARLKIDRRTLLATCYFHFFRRMNDFSLFLTSQTRITKVEVVIFVPFSTF